MELQFQASDSNKAWNELLNIERQRHVRVKTMAIQYRESLLEVVVPKEIYINNVQDCMYPRRYHISSHGARLVLVRAPQSKIIT
ncbi:hypothetical protein ROZALSC1DRAFT_28846 [Rozella allomycis CSF55]|uniref:Uncharacterized protein n=1 Tax=Rozella allomycis (strain CSF55) TaxID=988480 RepID=A0A075B3I7_ROZAC|nr:hypothetical protein O9G_005095 [Rozella allomycis CSF55]RKP19232.1 hypothetical protein ROZALSC1DRAFT_29149 [Rozella allomycis CSF55]RKP19574.1 hypothetical protein ROZALSC1DRAFT_28846 [Rozella allomycis CSF55]|eukprot:EPZ35546.1 hypothetical protein O9G_005095 [Rozella allomycis CSF55]